MDAGDLAVLVEHAQDGDAVALERVLLAVQDDIHRLAVRMTGCRNDTADAVQEILVKVMTRLATFRGEAAFRTWVHRVAVNHLLDRRRSATERLDLTFDDFAEDLHAGLAEAVPNEPDLDLLARDVKQGCTLALLTCLDRDLRVAYVLGEILGVSSAEGAWICEIGDAAFRKRLSRARDAVRGFVSEYCGLVAPRQARCHCRKRVPAAVALGRVDPARTAGAERAEVDAAVAEIEKLYDAADLLRSLPDGSEPAEAAVQIRALVRSGRYRVFGP